MPETSLRNSGASSTKSKVSTARNKRAAVVALVGLCFSLVGLSILAIFNLNPGIPEGSSSATVLLRSLGYLGLFVLVAVDSASVPIGSEVMIPFSGYLVYIGVFNFGLVVAIVTAASLTGALVDYCLARLLGEAFVERFLGRFGITRGGFAKAERLFRGKGSLAVLAARFVPVIRSLISLPAGLFKMPLKSFVVLTFLGYLGWTTALVSAGYAAGSLWRTVVGSYSRVVLGSILVIVAIASGSYLLRYANAIRRGSRET
jgi:membrane protein DedA with SNARE-associated domain